MENVATVSASQKSPRLGRSVGAVLAGLVTVIVTQDAMGWYAFR